LSAEEVNKYFNKFFVVPGIITDPSRLRLQDCMNLNANGAPLWIRFNAKGESEGLLAISIDLETKRDHNNNYPDLRYFLSRRNITEADMERSRVREDISNSRLQDNMYVTSSCDKW
jgi:hypothetical protein